MKNKIIIGIVIAILVICIVIESVFIVKQNNKNKSNPQEQVSNVETEKTKETPTVIPTKEPIELPEPTIIELENSPISLTISKEYFAPEEDDLVYTYMQVKVKEVNEVGRCEYNYQFDVPQINLDSTYVKKLNKNIFEKYEEIIDKISEEKSIDLNCEGLAYKYFENDGILSLVMYIPTESGGWFESEIYNINITTGEEVSNEELISTCAISEENFKDDLLLTIESDDMYKMNSSDPNIDENFVRSQKEKTIEKYKDISLNDIKLFINEDSKLCAYLIVYNVAGGDQGTRWANLETKKMDYNLFSESGPYYNTY